MKSRKQVLSIIFASAMMLLLILDTKHAYAGAVEGVALCINVIIPSLFPFFVVSSYLNSALQGIHIPVIDRVGKWLRIPAGCESLLAVGLLGGYPVGAQLIADACRQGTLDKRTGRILLGYCSNAGPAFIFGVAGSMFSSISITFLLWLIHLLSALITGFLLPRPSKSRAKIPVAESFSLVQSLRKSISICASVCSWVVIFKILLEFLNYWFSQILDPMFLIILSGLLELSNGCIQISDIHNSAIRFIICSLFLGFGGICVTLQTFSVTGNIGPGLYIPGKLIQACISLMLSMVVISLVFPDFIPLSVCSILLLSCVCVVILAMIYCKKRCGNPASHHI